MKKKWLIPIAVGALAAAAVMAACAGHEHTFGSEWSSDATSHWHQAVCSENDECVSAVSDKAEHTFDGGKVTKEATYNAEGEKTFTCAVCGYEKTEPVAAIEKSGVVYFAAEGTMVDQNGSTLPITTTLTVDFDRKEAVVEVIASIDVGGGYIMDFCMVTDEKDPDLEAANPMYYMSVMEIGKGTLSSAEAGRYTAEWAADAETEASLTLDAEGNASAVVQVAAVHPQAVELDEVVAQEGGMTVAAEGTMVDQNGSTLPITTTLTVDFTSGEAVVEVIASVDVGGGYIMDFCMVTDEKDPDLEAQNPMYYMSVMEIGKASVVRSGAFSYIATWVSGETAVTAEITVGIDGTGSAQVQIPGVHSSPVTLTPAE